MTRNHLAHINVNGSISAWNPNADDAVYTLAVSGSTVYVGGRFTNVGGQNRNNIAAMDVTTGNATAWNPGADSLTRSFLVNGNTLYVGGSFGNIGG